MYLRIILCFNDVLIESSNGTKRTSVACDGHWLAVGVIWYKQGGMLNTRCCSSSVFV